MKINSQSTKITSCKTNLLVIGLFEKEKLSKELSLIDKQLNGEISSIIKSKQFAGELFQSQTISTLKKIPARKILLLGLGKEKEFSLEILRKIAGLTTKFVKKQDFKEFATNLQTKIIKNTTIEQRTQALTEGFLLGEYKFTDYKTVDKDKIKTISSCIFLEDKKELLALNNGIKIGRILSDATNYVRDLVNTPAGIATPTFMANEAKKLAKNKSIKVKILGKKELTKLKMNALLGVSQGSSQEPKLVIIDYNSSKKESIALVGKGVTFDSGGLDIKPDAYMVDMKFDMAGAATVLGTMKSIVDLKIPHRVIGFMPLTENMPGSSAQKPGDVVIAYNKKTIEILNTDAEGRLILADTLAYAEKNYKPNAMIDLATLTGACIMALGYTAAAVMGTDEKLIAKLKSSGDETYERVWELPLWDEYQDFLKGDVADVRNIGNMKGYEAGTIVAGSFLKNFVEKTPWVHIDIAGTAWFIKETHYNPKGATGYGVRLLSNLLQNWKK